jgi:hypothetical protein
MCAVAEEPTADNRQPSLKVIASICPILPDLARSCPILPSLRWLYASHPIDGNPLFSRGFHQFFESDTSPVVKTTTSISCTKWLANRKKMNLGQFGQKSPIGMAFRGRGLVFRGLRPRCYAQVGHDTIHVALGLGRIR